MLVSLIDYVECVYFLEVGVCELWMLLMYVLLYNCRLKFLYWWWWVVFIDEVFLCLLVIWVL